MIQLTKRGIFAKKLSHGVRVAYALCGFDVWYQDDSKILTVALVIGTLQFVLHAISAIMSWNSVLHHLDSSPQMQSTTKKIIPSWIYWIISVVSFVTYSVFRLKQFKNRRTCGKELRRIYKNFEKFGIDMGNAGRDFYLFVILFLAFVTFGLHGSFDYILLRGKVSTWSICMSLGANMMNIFIDFDFIGGIYLFYLLYKILNEQCYLLKEVSDSIKYQIAIVKFIREQHQELASLTQSIVNAYEFPLILSIVRITLHSIIRMYNAHTLASTLSNIDATWMICETISFISLHSLRIFMMCSICTLMTSEANRTNTVLSEVESNNPYLYMRHERANLSLYLKQQNVRIRPWNLFEIDNGLFASVIGAILVYLFYFVDRSEVEQ